MAPFSMLRRSPRGRKGSEQQPNSGDDVKISNGAASRDDDQRGTGIESKDASEGETIKGRRGFNKDLLHSLRSRLTGKPPSSTPQRGTSVSQPEEATAATISDTSTTPLSPRIPANPNKPLPSPPPPGSEQTRDPPARPVLKLARIMATLTESEVEKLFSGAPQYFARSEGHYTGAPHPSVAFPWDEELEIRDLTDHTQIEDKAWSSVTAWPHITRDVKSDRSAAQRASEAEVKRRAHFYPRCRERPNMLSMFGLEKGSVGYQAALELAVADALQEPQWGFEGLGARLPAVIEQRQKMLTSKDGLRHVDETLIMEQLIKNGQRYSQQHLRERKVSSELYNELFLQILHPPTKVLDHRDPYSLSVQIMALVKVLAAPNMWIDFSHVEWRIRLGQLLWDNPTEESVSDGSSAKTSDSASDIHEERYWLLLQILLACELLVRLDAITEGEEQGMESIRPAEIHRFEKDANKSVKWSLILARVWLENIEVVKTEATQPSADEKPSGWLATLTKRMSLTRDPVSHTHHSRAAVYAIKGKYVQRQADGLAHFARRLRWPEADSYVSKVSENCRSVAEGTPLSTPLASPATRADSRRSSYFSAPNQPRRTGSRRKKISAVLHPSGWLSKSYVSGLMLPGEGLSHFLMATLLENDPQALSSLGPMANLCGGFVYSGKSFWSTASVVGRVLAAGKGAVECMGWISSDVLPEGLGDGWVNVEVEETKDDAFHVDKKARIWGKRAVENESKVLGDADPSSVFPADFIIPFENIYRDKAPPNLDVELKGLILWAPVDSVHTTPTEHHGATPMSDTSKPTPTTPQIHSYTASVTFTVTNIDLEEGREYTYSLAKDINFVTAHPCVPSQHVKIMKSPSSPTIQQVDLSGNSVAGRTASAVGHPLHKYHTYTALHLSELLTKQDFSLESLLGNYSSATHRPSLTPASSLHNAAKVLVIDCITGFQPQPQEHEIPLSPVLSRTESNTSAMLSPVFPEGSGGGLAGALESASKKMHSETRRRQFGSDMEILARAFCAEKGWNALISRRRRGCLACAIREAGALGWRVIIRVD